MSTASAPTSLSLVIATYDRGEELVETLRHFVADSSAKVEIRVVDQTPSYSRHVLDALEELQKAGYRHVYLRYPSLTLARNLGLRETSGEIVLFCDDDVVPSPGFLPAHLRPYADPTVGAVAGRVTGHMDDALRDPSRLTGRVRRDGSFTANFDSLEPADVDFGMGCNMSFRRSALMAAGGFDERYTGSFFREEGDAFARVKRLGYRVVFEPAAHVEHLAAPAGGCRADELRTRMASTFRNETLFFFNSMKVRDTPLFLARIARWMHATAKSAGDPPGTSLRYAWAALCGLGTHLFKRPDRLSAKLSG